MTYWVVWKNGQIDKITEKELEMVIAPEFVFPNGLVVPAWRAVKRSNGWAVENLKTRVVMVTCRTRREAEAAARRYNIADGLESDLRRLGIHSVEKTLAAAKRVAENITPERERNEP